LTENKAFMSSVYVEKDKTQTQLYIIINDKT